MNVEHDPIEPTASAAATPATLLRAIGAPRALAVATGVALLALLGFAYRALLTFRPTDSIVVELEGWFFEPSDTAPIVVVMLSLWLLYRRAGRLRSLLRESGPATLTVGLLAGALAVFVWALRTEASDLLAVSLILACFGAANLLGGLPGLGVVWLPVCFLLFAVPIPSPLRHAIVWKFQIWSAEATGMLLYLLGIPVVVSGDRIVLTDNVFAVIETCSGLRSLITLLMLAVLMIDLFRRSGLHAALILAFTPFLAFGTNALRCLGLVLNPVSSVASIHSLQGIGMLLASVLVLYAVDGLLERLGLPGSRVSPSPRRSGAPRVVRARLVGMAAFAALLGVFSVAIPSWRVAMPDSPLPVDVIPRRLDDWRSVDLETDRLFLGMAALTGVADRRYGRGSEWVDVFVAAGSPRQRFRSFYSPKTALPGSGWIVEERSASEIDGRLVDVLVVRKDAQRRLVHHWYLGTSGFAEELVREAIALDVSPFARSRRGVVVRLSTPFEGGPQPREKAEQRLARISTLLADPMEQL